ncbi:MAG: hypothetical protein Ct9H90mP4_05930 [Gammaproteobacteria bacterium]|nr:MAG: hypothetical protein Ct9H90mP4_05930 [Gammaproteobacteria bacterium]
MSSIGPLENAKKNLAKWMKPEKRKLGGPMPGAGCFFLL